MSSRTYALIFSIAVLGCAVACLFKREEFLGVLCFYAAYLVWDDKA